MINKYQNRCFNRYLSVISFLLCLTFGKLQAQTTLGYQKAPAAMEEILNATMSRGRVISSNGKWIVLLEKPAYPSLSELPDSSIKLGGLQVDISKRAKVQIGYTSIALKNVDEEGMVEFSGLPKTPHISEVVFSPDNQNIAFINTQAKGAELWLASVQTKTCTKLSANFVNNLMGKTFQWLPDGKTLLVKTTTSQQKPPLNENDLAPIVEESLGGAAPSITFPDVLKTEKQKQWFDYYATTQLQMIDLEGKAVNYFLPDVIKDFDCSPDGNYVMLHILQKPYSSTLPFTGFKQKVILCDKKGLVNKNLAEIPSSDYLPQGFDAVTLGAREFGWRADKPATYFYVEAQDLGDPAKKSTIRDIVYTQEVSNPSPKKLAVCYYRFNKINWGNDHVAIITERWYKTRAERRVFVKPNNANFRVNLWDRYYENSYDDPGELITTKNAFNKEVLLLDGNAQTFYDKENVSIFTLSDGASPQGKRPFILKFNIKTKITDTLFHSKAPYYDKPLFFNNQSFAIISRESVTENPNLFYTDNKKKNVVQLTYFTPPYPQLYGIQKKLLKYKRTDGLNLSATLYLPKDYQPQNGRLPVLLWAYPKEYKTANAAGQVKTSPYQFIHISWASPIFWVTQGYAVLDEVEMPVVGESNTQPNDTFTEQLIQNATAAIQKLSNMGIADEKRVAIGGHSYGAFMVANLLAHSKLFAAGIARSGAYNRSLTPFGFQSEERTYWEASELYNKMSPFTFANKVKTPLLLVHGKEDDNPGTYPLQSERFYNAIKGNGGISRLVLLPKESHSYQARESISHMLWEMDRWLLVYVKNKGLITNK